MIKDKKEREINLFLYKLNKEEKKKESTFRNYKSSYQIKKEKMTKQFEIETKYSKLFK